VNQTLMGIELKNYTMQRNGIFFLADSLTGITNLTFQCYKVSQLISHTLSYQVMLNVNQPIQLLYNVASQSFYITSALLAQFANFNYHDWFSLFYWFGDIFFRILVVQTNMP